MTNSNPASPTTAAATATTNNNSNNANRDEINPLLADPSLVAKVRKFLESLLNEIKATWIRRLTFQCMIVCPCGKICDLHKTPYCSNNICLHFLNLDHCLSNPVSITRRILMERNWTFVFSTRSSNVPFVVYRPISIAIGFLSWSPRVLHRSSIFSTIKNPWITSSRIRIYRVGYVKRLNFSPLRRSIWTSRKPPVRIEHGWYWPRNWAINNRWSISFLSVEIPVYNWLRIGLFAAAIRRWPWTCFWRRWNKSDAMISSKWSHANGKHSVRRPRCFSAINGTFKTKWKSWEISWNWSDSPVGWIWGRSVVENFSMKRSIMASEMRK